MMYASSLFQVMESHLPEVHGYADDHQLYMSFKPSEEHSESNALNAIESCIQDIRRWMVVNKLKLNDSKTEIMLLGTHVQLSKVNLDSVNVGDTAVQPTSFVRNLGS